jgi:hypothetical protein
MDSNAPNAGMEDIVAVTACMIGNVLACRYIANCGHNASQK